MHIGLIGGIGPAATIAYYTRLVAVFRAAGTPLHLTIVHADVAALAANAAAGNRQDQAEIFAGHIRALKGAGCEVATITALTGHFCFEETAALSDLPLVNPIPMIDADCAGRGLARVGLLGSPMVMSTALFGYMARTETVVPSGVADIGAAYMEMAMTGRCSAATRRLMVDAAAEMVVAQGAGAVLLVGTDLGLAFDGEDPGVAVIDALDIHVDGLLALAGGPAKGAT